MAARFNRLPPQLLDELNRLMASAADRGQLIEAGWLGLRIAAVPADAPPVQLDEMRNAFFAGAQHLFSSIMGVLDAGEEITEQDLQRMSNIQAELDLFIAEYGAKHLPTQGTA